MTESALGQDICTAIGHVRFASESGHQTQHALHYSGTPSLMEAKAKSVGMMRDSVNPARANKLRNSASERWRPPVHTNILISLAAAPRLASD
jgi:hypothetical protein